MRKNKKIIAILTLVLFAMSMLPVAAFAAPASATLEPATQTVAGGSAATITATIPEGSTVDGTLYLVDKTSEPNVAYAGNGMVYGFNVPAATDVEQTIDYILVDAADANAALTATGINGATAKITVPAKAQPTVAIVEPLTIGDTVVKVTLTEGVEDGDTVALYEPNNNTAIATINLTANQTEAAFENLKPLGVGEYKVVFTNATVTDPEEKTKEDKALTQRPEAQRDVAVSDASILEVVDKKVDVNEASEVKVSLRDAFGDRITATDTPIFVWAEERVGQPTSALTEVKGADPAQGAGNVYTLKVDRVDTLELTFSRAGEYSVYASLANPNVKVDDTNPNYGENAAYGNVAVFKSTSRTVTVEADKADIVAIEVAPFKGIEAILFDGEVYDGKTPNLDVSEILVDPNGVSETPIDFTVYQYKDGFDPKGKTREEKLEKLKAVDIGIDVSFDTNSNAIKVNPTKDTTDYNGEVDIEVTGTVEGNYKIYVKAGNVEIIVPVKVAPLRADDIKVTKQPEGPIASGSYDECGEFKFQILDPNGMIIADALNDEVVLGAEGLKGELVHSPYGLKGKLDGKFIKLTAPKAADLEEDNVFIKPNEKGEYCVTFDKDLVAGDYSLEFVLDNGRKATFAWTVKDFGTAKELKIEYPRDTVELGGITGEPDIYFLDENGVKKDAAKYVDLGASGYAIRDFKTETGVVTVENDEKYIGDTINVYAVAEREGLTAQATLTVTSGEGHLVFDQSRGPVNFNNRVPFKVVDSEGNTLALGNDKEILSKTVVVTKQSNPDAKISGNVAAYSEKDLKENGTGILNLTSDKEGTAEVKVTIVARSTTDSAQNSYDTQVYSGTLNYTFGDASEYDGRIVVMVIGSADTIVDNKIVTIDAAPFVNADWRTMVPFRALAEDFGAQVEWNEADQTVTAELDGVTLVMTIGSETYTVNGVEKTMDTAPVIVDGRTYVPVRFPAEAFGFDVVPTYNDEGLTSSVLFTK